MPARISVENRSNYHILLEQGEARAELAGRLRHDTLKKIELPGVGDWVACSPPTSNGPAVIEAVLPRASVFTRRAAGKIKVPQVVAANVDVVFIVTSLNAELNARRLERYLTLAWESGAVPDIVISKADRAEDGADGTDLMREVATVASGVVVHLTSAKTGRGLAELAARLQPNRTGALLGSSGVGKSTLINALLGFERQATAEVREGDQKGRHTTTRRELVLLPMGGVLIDTPGMREMKIADAGHGLLTAFDDIEELAKSCAFGDCTHGPEPDCAVKRAVADGTLDAGRLASYHKLEREMKFRTRWEDKRAAAQEKKRVISLTKAYEKQQRNRNK